MTLDFKDLPPHWDFLSAEEAHDIWHDSCRDYTKPIFLRRDVLARIYFCSQPSSDCVFSIKFDFHNDGECFPTLKKAIDYCDKYIEKYQLEYHVCQICSDKANWYYTPASSNYTVDRFYCANHVPRGCSCNINPDGTEALDDDGITLRPLPCCEYTFNEYGFPKEE